LEQMRQQLVGDAVAQVTPKLQADKNRIGRELDPVPSSRAALQRGLRMPVPPIINN
jgi:hypothetical protein